MNKTMKEIMAKIQNRIDAARAESDAAKKKAMLDEITALKEEYDTEKALFDAEKAMVPNAPTEPASKGKADGFVAMAKKVSGRKLTDIEDALISGEDAENGENLLIPEDVDLAIRELRREFQSAKDLVTILPASTLTGTFNYENGPLVGLTAFTDGETVAEGDEPTFTRKSWAIKFFGKLMYLSNILTGAEKAGLMVYLRNWFVKNAILTENDAIFAALKLGKTAKNLTGWKALKKSINTDLDPSTLRAGAVIVTNQNGFDYLDSEEDANGRPILQENPADRTEKRFQGLPIRVFPNSQLKDDATKGSPIFYGDLKAGVYFHDYMKYQFKTSEHFAFNKNQNTLRVLEGFDVTQADAADEVYIYGFLKAAAQP